MLRSVLGIIGLVFLFQGSFAKASTIAVPGDAISIQQAIDNAQSNDTIVVSPGTYRESIEFRGKDIVLTSRRGALETVLTGSDSATLVTLKRGETRSTIIEGFTFKGGWIAVYCENSAATIRRNVFVDQKTTDWAAICLAGPGYPPSASYGPAGAVIERNTILRSANGGISSFSTEPPEVRYNIIAFCGEYGIHFQGEFENIKLSHNDVFGNRANYINVFYGGLGSFSEDPLVEPSGRIQGGSPCIDRGDTIDNDGDMVGPAFDIGAIEFAGIQAPYPSILTLGPRVVNNVVAGQTPTIAWPTPDGSYVGYQVQLTGGRDWDRDLLWDTGKRLVTDTAVIYSGEPLTDGAGYYVRVRLFDGKTWGSWRCSPLITRSYLRVGFEAAFPPFEFIDSTGATVGFDVDIARGVAAMLQRGIKITTAGPDELLQMLKRGELDILGAMQISDERDRFLDFTPPYASLRHTVFALKGTREINSVEDLRDERLAVVEGGLMYDYVLEHGLTNHLTVVDDPASGLRRLIAGNYTYLILGRVPGTYWIDQLGLNNVEIVGPVIVTAKLCMAVTEGNTELQAELTEGLNMLHRTDRYEAIGEQWFGPSDAEHFTGWSMVELVYYGLLPILLIVGGVGLWNWSLRRKVAQRTEDLSRELAERKRAQAALRESEALARALLRAPTDSIFLISTDMTVIDCNETAEKSLKMKREDMVGRSWTDLLPADVALERSARAQYCVETGQPCRFEDQHRDRWLDHVFYPIFDNHGQVYSIAVISRDISHRKRMEKEIKESEARFRALFDSAQDAIFMKDCSLRYVLVNPAMEKMFDMVGANLLNLTTEELFGEEAGARMIEMDKRVLCGEILSEQHTIVMRGVKRTYDMVVVPMRKTDGDIIGICGIARDVTETERLQRFSERAKRLETAGRIAGQVAHDFNNLLGPLLAYPDLIREKLPANSSLLPLLEDIERSAEQMAEINQQLLTLGRRGHYNQDPIDLNRIVNQVLDRFDTESVSVEAHTHLETTVLPMLGGASQIQRAVTNLLTNAYEAINGMGTVSVLTANRYFDEVYDGFERIPAGEYVELVVADSGLGIPKDIMSRIFDPFFTTKKADRHRGSGLGLSVVHAVVKDHGGFIDVISSVSKGTQFHLYFPASRDAVVLTPDEELECGQGEILVVDDDSTQLRVSRVLLERLGYTVHTVDSGEAAIETVTARSFDLILLDMIMPKGLDGAETLQRIMELSPTQKTLIVSGYAETDRVKRAIELGAGAFVRKPLTLKALAIAVKTELNRPIKE